MERPFASVRLIWGITLIGCLVWVAAAVAAPWLRARGWSGAEFLYAVYRPICHQLESRCFEFWGEPAAVCARCLGIYAGFLTGTLGYPLFRGFKKPAPPSIRIFLAFSFPIAVDFAGNLLGGWQTPGGWRFGLGWIWGMLLPAYLIAGLAQVKVSDFRAALTRKKMPRANG